MSHAEVSCMCSFLEILGSFLLPFINCVLNILRKERILL